MVIEGKETRVQGSDTLIKNITSTSMLVDEFYLNRSWEGLYQDVEVAG